MIYEIAAKTIVYTWLTCIILLMYLTFTENE